MIKLIITVIIFIIYSVAVFLCGRGYGNAENFQYISNLKNENMMLKNDLSLKCVEDNDEELKVHMRKINEFNKICKENIVGIDEENTFMHKRFLEKQIEKWQKERDEMDVVCDKARESLKK